MKVPLKITYNSYYLLTGISKLAIYFKQKLMKDCNLSSPKASLILVSAKKLPSLKATNPFSENQNLKYLIAKYIINNPYHPLIVL